MSVLLDAQFLPSSWGGDAVASAKGVCGGGPRPGIPACWLPNSILSPKTSYGLLFPGTKLEFLESDSINSSFVPVNKRPNRAFRAGKLNLATSRLEYLALGPLRATPEPSFGIAKLVSDSWCLAGGCGV